MNTFFYTNPVIPDRVAKIVTDLTVDELTKIGIFESNTKFVIYNNEIDADLEQKFFNTIKFDDSNDPTTVIIDMDHAKSIRLEEIREKRNALLAVLDTEALKYMTKPDIITVIDADKDMLRDLPEKVTFAKVKEARDLLSVIPPELEVDYAFKYKTLLNKINKKAAK